jgi:hypothetical protein
MRSNLTEKKPMKTQLSRALLVLIAFTSVPSFALERLRGEARIDGQYIGFTVAVQDRNYARLAWDDGYPGFTGYYNPRPNPAPRCPCKVYDNGPRQIIVEFDPRSGRNIGVHFGKN